MEARWLVEEAAPDPWPAALDRPVTVRAATWFEQMVARREAGEPLQYVLGHWAFRTLDLMVDPRVLIPRPETETVVEIALRVLDDIAAPEPLAVDLGTGSGAIALSLAAERPGLAVWATDESPDALAVASANLAGLGGWAAPRVRLVAGSWWDALPEELRGRVTLAVSNPPYISSGEMASLDPGVTGWEPNGALDAGPEGLEDIRAVVTPALLWLAAGGALVVEIAPHQADASVALATAAGLVGAEVRPDLTGRPRALVARGPGSVAQWTILSALGDPPPHDVVAMAAAALRAGDIVGVPTDTVYGLAADPWHTGAADRLFRIKGRPRAVELPVLVADIAQALTLATEVPAAARRLMEEYWPGALTVVLPRRPDLEADLGEDDATIGLRCPAHPVPLALCLAVGPIATTSANLHGAPPATTAAAVAALPGLDLVLDGGVCAGSPSTVVDCTGADIRVLRQGSVWLPGTAGA